MPPESSVEVLRRYMALPPEQRLKAVEDNLSVMVQILLGNEPQKVATNLPTHAVVLDLVREIRHIKAHLGLASPKDSEAPEPGQVESPIVGKPEVVDDSEIPPSLLSLVPEP